MSLIRTFVAIPCPLTVQEELAKYGKAITEVNPKAKLILPFNYHITLAYLGETDTSRVNEIKELLSFPWREETFWEISRLGAFSSHKIVYASGPKCPAIELLGEKVRRLLRQNGFSFDEKPLRAHISLARNAYEVPEVEFSRIQMTIQKPELFQSGVKINNKLTYIKL